MFINVSNHPSANWQEAQLAAAETFGSIIDLPFPDIHPDWDGEEIDRLVDEYEQRIKEYGNSVVLVQGEFTFTHRLVNRLKSLGFTVVASCSARRVTEEKNEDGDLIRTSRFAFVRFREY